LQDQAKVTAIVETNSVFEVRTEMGVFAGNKLVIAPGPYVDSVINLLGFTIAATYWNMSSAYFRISDPKLKLPTWFVFQNPIEKNGNQFYGFPAVDWDYPGYIRVAPDFVMSPISDPSKRTSVPNSQELGYTSDWVRNHMRGLDPTPAFTSTCLVALSTLQDKQMILDFAPVYVPRREDVIVFATGWAAKFTPLIGRILADLALDGKTSFDIEPFQLGDIYFSAI
jgi:sarcosine oxidase/sarcosine oxidase/L-pipecolate oxidase